MRKRISRIAPVQLGKVAAVVYGVLSIPIMAIMAIAALFGPHANSTVSLVMIVVFPIIYIVFGFIFMALGALIYNLAAKWVGGIEFVTEEVSEA
ncbi:MAG TPA: hypothetical protein VH040_02935 [Usitatibacter sp.]|jgi:hypothetical protein|nr:hypothetical protein [Usitatibacter sp.]